RRRPRSSSPEGLARKREVGERPQKRRAVVQAGRPPEVRDSRFPRRFREELVHLVERLDVVADERDRNDEHLRDSGPSEPADLVQGWRSKPLDLAQLRLISER